jgi:hypothetical protein
MDFARYSEQTCLAFSIGGNTKQEIDNFHGNKAVRLEWIGQIIQVNKRPYVGVRNLSFNYQNWIEA